MTTSITFKYHYRLENVNKTLVEFNHDAGLTDDIGKVNHNVATDSMAFLLRDQYDDPVMKQYIGAAGMFTGSPYIVMQLSQPDPLNKSNIRKTAISHFCKFFLGYFLPHSFNFYLKTEFFF